MRFEEVAVDNCDPLLSESYKSMRCGEFCGYTRGKNVCSWGTSSKRIMRHFQSTISGSGSSAKASFAAHNHTGCNTMPQALRSRTLTRRNKVARAIWEFVWLLLFRPSPKIFHSWRCMLARLFGARLGKGIRLYPSAKIWAPWNLTMEDNSCLGPNVDCYCVDKIHIGRQAVVSQYSYLCTASHDYQEQSMPLISAPIIIEEYAWITADVFVGPGVKIGSGAVINVRSSVLQDIPPWVVARGNPATPYKKRTFNLNGSTMQQSHSTNG